MELKGNIVITIEDILFNTSESLGKYIRDNYYPTFCTVFKQLPLDVDVNKRPIKDFSLSILKKTARKESYLKAVKHIYNNYYNEETYEKYLSTTELYEKLTNSIAFLESNVIEHIYILYNENISETFLRKYFKHKKFIFIKTLNVNEIYKFLQSIKWNLLITDIAGIVDNIIKNQNDVKNKEFMIKKTNYSQLEYKKQVWIEEMNGKIVYY